MIVDASIWVASVLEEDAHHKISMAFMHRFVTERQIATVPLLAWAKIAGAVARRTGCPDRGMKVAGFIAAKIWVRGVPLEASLASESMRLAARLRLRGADAVYTSSGQEFRFLKSLKYRVCGIPIVVAAGVDSGFLLPLQPRTPTRCRAHRARLQAQVTSDQVTTINTQYLPV